MLKKLMFFILTLIFLSIITGCNFTKTTTNTFDKVKTGMSPEQVIEAMGEAAVKTTVEIWRYQENNTIIDISIQDGQVVNVRTFTVKSLQN
jgi:hypothetical protein